MLFPACIWWTRFHQKQNAAFFNHDKHPQEAAGRSPVCSRRCQGRGAGGEWGFPQNSRKLLLSGSLPRQRLQEFLPPQKCYFRNVTGSTLGSSQTHSCSSQNELKQQFRMLCPERALTWLLLLFIYDGKGKVLPELHHPVLGKVNSFAAFSPADTPLWVIPQCHLLSAFSHSGWVTPGWWGPPRMAPATGVNLESIYWSVNLGITPWSWKEGAKGRSWALFWVCGVIATSTPCVPFLDCCTQVHGVTCDCCSPGGCGATDTCR